MVDVINLLWGLWGVLLCIRHVEHFVMVLYLPVPQQQREDVV